MGAYHHLIYQKPVDICGAEVSFHVLNDNKQGLFRDSIQSKSIPENAIINSDECTGFLKWLPCYCMSCIYKATKKSKYMYSLLVYNENHKQTIQCSKNINGTASLVEAVRNASLTTGHYKIVSCSCAKLMLTEVEGNKNRKNHRQKQDYEAMEPSKKKKILRKETSEGYDK